nr:MAG TPA: hypothetical protein [Bacteriophage sp.]
MIVRVRHAYPCCYASSNHLVWIAILGSFRG